MRNHYIFVALLCLFTVGLVATAFMLTGTPDSQRAKHMDELRLSDFRSISDAIDDYYSTYGELPVSLERLRIAGESIRADPETRTEYTYIPGAGSSRSYQLCANFSAKTPESPITRSSDVAQDDTGTYKVNPAHERGHDCIEYSVGSSNAKSGSKADEPFVTDPTSTLTAGDIITGTYQSDANWPQQIHFETPAKDYVVAIGRHKPVTILDKNGKETTYASLRVGDALKITVADLEASGEVNAAKVQIIESR